MMDKIANSEPRHNNQNIDDADGNAAPASGGTKNGAPNAATNLLGSKSSLASFIISGLVVAALVATIVLTGAGMGGAAIIAAIIAAALCIPFLFLDARGKAASDDPNASGTQMQKRPHNPRGPEAVRNAHVETGAAADDGEPGRIAPNGRRQRSQSA